MRKESLKKIYELAKIDKNIVFIGSDLGKGSVDFFEKDIPEQFFMEGISESHIVSMSAGLALMGKKVFAHTIAPFFVRRALEQIILDIGCENLDVTLLCSGGGVVYGPLGHSHTMVDDFAILANVPNLKIYAPADSFEMEKILEHFSKTSGPNYIRMGKGNEARIENANFQIEKPTFYSNDNSNKDVLVVTTGVMLHTSLRLQQKFDLAIAHYHFVPKSINDFPKTFGHYKKIIIIEEHLKFGGLTTRFQAAMCEANLNHMSIHSFNLGDSYIYEYGKQEEIFEILGLDFESLSRTIAKIILKDAV